MMKLMVDYLTDIEKEVTFGFCSGSLKPKQNTQELFKDLFCLFPVDLTACIHTYTHIYIPAFVCMSANCIPACIKRSVYQRESLADKGKGQCVK